MLEEADIKPDLKAVANYLRNLNVGSPNQSFTKAVKLKARYFLLHGERLYRRTKKRLRLVQEINLRSKIFHEMHDEIGHWDFDAT